MARGWREWGVSGREVGARAGRGARFGGRPAGRARLARWGKNTKAAGSPDRAGGAISTEK